MIIELLLNAILLLISAACIPLTLISFPSSVLSVIATAMTYITGGFRIVAFYTHFVYLLDLFAICISFDVLLRAYKVIMWILRKIPFLNIS